MQWRRRADLAAERGDPIPGRCRLVIGDVVHTVASLKRRNGCRGCISDMKKGENAGA
jgi:hypothetical protein